MLVHSSELEYYGSRSNRSRSFVLASVTIFLTHFLGIALLVRWGWVLPWISNLAIGFAVWALLMTWFFSYRKYSRINQMFDTCGSDEQVKELLVLSYQGVSQLMIGKSLVAAALFLGLAWAAAALKKAGG